MTVPQGYFVQNPTFQPAMRNINAITKDLAAAVTTTSDHDYETGDIVRLFIPIGWGMVQADGLIGEITVTGTDSFTITINTSIFDSFVIPPDPSPGVISVAQVIPVGEVNSKLTQATRNVLRRI